MKRWWTTTGTIETFDVQFKEKMQFSRPKCVKVSALASWLTQPVNAAVNAG
jgi:hypothetical protein